MNKISASLIRTVTAALIIVFAAICLGFIPGFSAYLDGFLTENGIAIGHVTAIVCGFGILAAIPVFIILALAMKLPRAVAEDRIFTVDTAALLSRIACIFFGDCILLLCAVISLLLVGEFLVSPLLALIDLIGFALAFLLRILADYVRRAAILKEEADCTL